MKLLAAWLMALLVPAWAIEPRKSPAEYRAQAETPAAALGAEYIGRFVTGNGGSHAIGDYIAIEVGYYPKTREAVAVRGSDFMLRINGAKQLVYPQVAQLVAGAIRNPHWERQRGLVTGVGMGGGGIVIGGPRQRSRFPGDPTVRAPMPDPTSTEQGVSQDSENDPLEEAARAVAGSALPEGGETGVRAGYIYFIYGKKLSTLKKIELVWIAGDEKRSLVLK
ncbi:MAG: hypothetical protein C0504_02555 [Candidatus Solibacter sp.]|nr:hypothetical protein [Candidatus Solibacter sp.]